MCAFWFVCLFVVGGVFSLFLFVLFVSALAVRACILPGSILCLVSLCVAYVCFVLYNCVWAAFVDLI